jgi:hypothetical protein
VRCTRPLAPYVNQKENINKLQLLGARRAHNQRKQAGKNGKAKLAFLLENIVIFKTVTLIFT